MLSQVFNISPTQDNSMGKICYKRLWEISGSVALVLMGYFNFPDIDWEYQSMV